MLYLKRILMSVMLALATGGVAFAQADVQPVMNDAQRKSIEAVVKSYILANPEVVEEALQELDRRKQVAQKSAQDATLTTEKDALFNAAHSAVVGNSKGKVSLVEFFDYNCGYCKKAALDVDQLIKKDPELRVVLKDFPVLGPDSVEAHEVALAVKNQLSGDKYWAFHMKAMALKGTVGKTRMLEVAKDSGVDMAKLTNDLQPKELRALLSQNIALGDKLGLTGTPSYVIDKEILFGAVGLETLTQTVANVRKCGKAEC